MKMVHIMNYKLLIYVISLMLCSFALSGINFEKIIKKNMVWETRILVIILSLALAYLVTNFIFDFIDVSRII